ncbi:MAG: hypothetical protein K0S45_3262 [Nitrospira sp.]|jgi:hypothetical protein|nr:hypothetical protein [Nitrospira sp.]
MHTQFTHSSFRTVAFIGGVIFGTVSCQAQPEGYWTSADKSQALTNQEYPADAQRCQSLVASDDPGQSPPYKARLFTQCMQAKGYQWIVEPGGRHPLNADAQRSPLSLDHCPNGRLTIDAFGYQKCVPSGTKEGGIFEGTTRPTPPKVPSGPRANATILQQPRSPLDGRAKDDERCRQYAKESMSSTYGVYAQCMRDRGWPSKP